MTTETPCLKPASDFASFLKSPTIIVRVGTDSPEDFHVHKSLLCDNSPFFKSAITKDWEESKTGIVNLPEDDPEAFALYSSWLYSVWSFFEMQVVDTEGGTRSKCANVQRESVRPGRAYLFGDKILDRDFCDFVIDCIQLHVAQTKRIHIEHYYVIFTINDEWFSAEHKLDEEAWKEIAHSIRKKAEGTSPLNQAPWHPDSACKYHWHTKDGGECYKTKKSWSMPVQVAAKET